MRGKVKHAGKNGKHFYIYLGAQVVMEYLKLVRANTRGTDDKIQAKNRKKMETKAGSR